MFYLVLPLYSLIVLIYVIIYFFIVYHLVKYSINASLNKKLLPFFIIISTLLLISNVLLFLSINWQSVFLNLSL